MIFATHTHTHTDLMDLMDLTEANVENRLESSSSAGEDEDKFERLITVMIYYLDYSTNYRFAFQNKQETRSS